MFRSLLVIPVLYQLYSLDFNCLLQFVIYLSLVHYTASYGAEWPVVCCLAFSKYSETVYVTCGTGESLLIHVMHILFFMVDIFC